MKIFSIQNLSVFWEGQTDVIKSLSLWFLHFQLKRVSVIINICIFYKVIQTQIIKIYT
jgi:hypothetical protein